MDVIYLDNNATTPIDPQVARVIGQCFDEGHVNPASQHGPGRAARKKLETAREEIAALLGARIGDMHSDRFVFTGGGTESNHLALRGVAARRPGRIIVSALEHPSLMGAAEMLQRAGRDVCRLPCSSAGVVDLEQLSTLLDEGPTSIVSVMLVNNETGVIQPMEEIAALCRQAETPLHCDAAQAVGKLDVDFHRLGVNALTVTAHKTHGPVGVGGLLIDGQLELDPLMLGGFQQQGLRPGTESVALAVGFAETLRRADELAETRRGRMLRCRDLLERLLAERLPQIVVNGASARRAPHTSNISFPGADRQALLMALDARRVACSTGSACASGSSDPSPVLLAMGASPSIVESSLRFSVSGLTTEEEIKAAVERIVEAAPRVAG